MSAELSTGRVIGGRYRIERLLGRGGFASVYEAKHTTTEHPLALKILRARGEEDAVRFSRFFQEAKVTAHLSHPNTVRVFDFGREDSGVVYLAMELLTGPTLREEANARLERGASFSEEEVLELGVAVLRSLAEAHAHGLVHRDLKPENIMYHRVAGDRPVVKVVDFGIAKLLGSEGGLTGAQSPPCTPIYASPELLLGETIDARSDLYALGIILFELLAGRPPFHADNLLELAHLQVHGALPDLKKLRSAPLSEELAGAIARATEKHPVDRYADAAEMRGALESCRAALPEAITHYDGETAGNTTTLPAFEATSTTTDDGTKVLDAPNTVVLPPKPLAKRSAVLPISVLALVLAAAAALWSSRRPSPPASAPVIAAPVVPEVRVAPREPADDPAPAEEPPAPIKERKTAKKRAPQALDHEL